MGNKNSSLGADNSILPTMSEITKGAPEVLYKTIVPPALKLWRLYGTEVTVFVSLYYFLLADQERNTSRRLLYYYQAAILIFVHSLYLVWSDYF